MHRIRCLCLVLLTSSPLWADPTLTISDQGLNVANNREWLVEIAPDSNLFVDGSGSVFFELAFEVSEGELVDTVVNATTWPFATPGNDPFTGNVTLGLDVDLDNDTVFASFGSDPFTSGDAVNALTIETLGSGMTTLSWGGHTLLPGTQFEYVGSRISQGGTNFNGYMGALTLGDSPSGDFNGDGDWNCADIDALTAAVANGSTDLSFDMNADGAITEADITATEVGWLAVGGAQNPMQTGGNAFLVGDMNLDGGVDASDFNIWNANKFTANTAWCNGNVSPDTVIDVADFNRWNSNRFQSSAAALPVPEPAGWIGLVWASALLLGGSRADLRRKR